MGHPNPLVGQINDISLSVGTSSGFTAPFVFAVTSTTGEAFSVWGWAQALQSQVRKERPQIGDFFACWYRGRKESTQRANTSYHDYVFKVLRDRSGSAIDWSHVPLAGGGEGDVFAEPVKAPEKEPSAAPAGGSSTPDDIPFAPIP
jgi:hypothetical protein